MGVQITRESDGRVTVTIAGAPSPVALSPIEARLLAIKLLLAAEELKTVPQSD
jgi:hypothetical protein